MRDIIWTIILVWFIYKIVDLFRSVSVKRSAATSSVDQETPHHSAHHHSASELKNAAQKHANNEGEYIDFEELK